MAVLNRPIFPRGKRPWGKTRDTPIELRLGAAMRGLGLRFERQWPIGKYRCDFAFPGIRLDVESDGQQHYIGNGPAHDHKRDVFFHGCGWYTLRFTGREIMRNADLCARTVRDLVADMTKGNRPQPGKPYQKHLKRTLGRRP